MPVTRRIGIVSICATPTLVFEIHVAAIFAACDIDVLARRNKRLALFELRNAFQAYDFPQRHPIGVGGLREKGDEREDRK